MSRIQQLIEDVRETQGLERWGTESEPAQLHSDKTPTDDLYSQAAEILGELREGLFRKGS